MIFDSNRKLSVVDLTSAWKGVNHHYFFYKSSHTSLSIDSSISIIKETSQYLFFWLVTSTTTQKSIIKISKKVCILCGQLNEASLLFVDNPVGTGYSYVTSDDAYTTNVSTIATDLLAMMTQFLKENTDFQVQWLI